MIYTTEVCLFFLLSWQNAFIWHILTTSEYQYATLVLPFYSCSSQFWHSPVIFPLHQHCHLSGPPVSWSGKPRRLHVQSAFGGFSSLNQIIIGLASTRAVTRKEVGIGTYCQSSGCIDLHCWKLLQKTLKVKTQPLIIQKLLLYLLKLLKWTALTHYWLFHLASKFHAVLALLRDSKVSSLYCTGSKVSSHDGPLKTKKLQQYQQTLKWTSQIPELTSLYPSSFIFHFKMLG